MANYCTPLKGNGYSCCVIGIYDVAQGYHKVEEFTGFGIGPHEVIIMPDGNLAIGVGGVHTDGRTPKNLDSMQPSLVMFVWLCAA